VSESSNQLYGFSAGGAQLAGFPTQQGISYTCGTAVDPAGHAWASNSSVGLSGYDSAGNPVGSFFVGQQYCRVAFDAAGNLYYAQSFGQVEKYNPDGFGGFTLDPTTPVVDAGPATAVATDPATGHVYVAHTSSISEYDASGSLVTNFGAGILSNAVGVA